MLVTGPVAVTAPYVAPAAWILPAMDENAPFVDSRPFNPYSAAAMLWRAPLSDWRMPNCDCCRMP